MHPLLQAAMLRKVSVGVPAMLNFPRSISGPLRFSPGTTALQPVRLQDREVNLRYYTCCYIICEMSTMCVLGILNILYICNKLLNLTKKYNDLVFAFGGLNNIIESKQIKMK